MSGSYEADMAINRLLNRIFFEWEHRPKPVCQPENNSCYPETQLSSQKSNLTNEIGRISMADISVETTDQISIAD